MQKGLKCARVPNRDRFERGTQLVVHSNCTLSVNKRSDTEASVGNATRV